MRDVLPCAPQSKWPHLLGAVVPPFRLFEMVAKRRLRDASELLVSSSCLNVRGHIGILPEHLFDELLLPFVGSLLMKGAVASSQREFLVVGHSLDEFGWVAGRHVVLFAYLGG